MKLLIFSMLILSFNCFGVSRTFLKMKPNKEYMGFFINRYLTWHDQHFYPFPQTPFVKTLISHVDHWIVAAHPEYYQFQFGHKISRQGDLEQIMRIYIHESLRNHADIKAARLPKDFVPWFYEDRIHRKCFIGPEIRLAETLVRFCQQGNSFVRAGSEYTANSMTPNWPNPFPSLAPKEIRSLNINGELESVYYESFHTHISRMPRELDRVINLHVTDTHLSLQRYSIDRKGEWTIYFP